VNKHGIPLKGLWIYGKSGKEEVTAWLNRWLRQGQALVASLPAPGPASRAPKGVDTEDFWANLWILPFPQKSRSHVSDSIFRTDAKY